MLKRKKQKSKRKFGLFLTEFIRKTRKIIRTLLIWLTLRVLVIFGACFLSCIIYFYLIIPPFETILDGRKAGSVTFLDKDGNKFAWRGEQFSQSISSQDENKYLKYAIISSEDKNFYAHFGISLRGILGAIRINLSEGRGPLTGHGGSTITQQVAKLTCFMNYDKIESACRKQSISRKILEVPFAIALETKFAKDEILSIYMNRVYLGAGATGFEAASQRYFDKSISELSLAESAMLVALLKAPSKYAPTRNLKLAQKRATLVINSMLREQHISAELAEIAIAKPAELSKTARLNIGAHFADWIMQDAPEVLTRKTTEDILINTTFDPVIQKHVQDSVSKVFASSVNPTSQAEVAVVVMTSSGDVVAMLGGRRNTSLQGQYNRAFQAYRQPGSAFKPFVYAAALQQGYAPDYSLNDTQKPPPEMSALKYWPKNYNNNYVGKITLDSALASSVNTVTVQLAHLVGIKSVISVAEGLGIKSELKKNLSLALGSSEVSLLNLTSAYAGFLNLGRKVQPRGWLDLRLKSNNEVLIEATERTNKQVLDKHVSRALIKMLVSAIDSGTGKKAYINGWDTAGKTGTSQDARDAWFIGFTSEYVVGVWMGTDDNMPLTGVVGGNLPSQIWSQIIQRIHAEVPGKLPSLSTKDFKKERSNQKIKNNEQLYPQSDSKRKNNIFLRFLNYFNRINRE